MSTAPALQPREPRQSVFLAAELVRKGATRSSRHRVRNISPHGACIDCADQRRCGEVVAISVGDLVDIDATIAWVDGDLAGLCFVHPIRTADARARVAIRPATGSLWRH